jgi:hypothetical protein
VNLRKVEAEMAESELHAIALEEVYKKKLDRHEIEHEDEIVGNEIKFCQLE